jgi:hypothetical protein
VSHGEATKPASTTSRSRLPRTVRAPAVSRMKSTQYEDVYVYVPYSRGRLKPKQASGL